MSLQRYYNHDSILSLNAGQYGQLFTDNDLNLLDSITLTPYDPKLVENNIAELHLYTYNGDYLGVDENVKYIVLDDVSNSLLVNVREVFNIANIDKGSYKIIINLLRPLFGSPDNFPLFLKEISPDRTELKLELKPNSSIENQFLFQEFKEAVSLLKTDDVLNHIVVNFGFNNLLKIINIKFDPVTDAVYVKLYDEFPTNLFEKDLCWIGFEVMDPFSDVVTLTSEIINAPINKLRSPNFNIDVDLYNSNSTVYKSWNDLLDTDSTTRGSILNLLVSGSGVQLNIDYTDYKNFIHYSSAAERIENFKYKLQLIEYFNAQRTQLSSYSGSNNLIHLQTNKTILQRRKDNIISSFTPFERWLYYEPTGSIFTHGITGSLSPWPKYIRNNTQYVHHTTSSWGINWYNLHIVSASAYDAENYNKLTAATPDHILSNPDNSEYITFLDMMGEHFDDLFSYIKELTSIHERDEHPTLGPPNELLPYIAEGMGWKVQNTKQLSELWLYAAGTNNSGSFSVPSGSMVSLPHRNLNFQIWRRVVNNLPYLLKTKGTARSVKALLSIYGIPHTLISIKEYGGPSLNPTKPALIEDRFSYKINFTSGTYIDFPREFITASNVPWTYTPRQPDTIEFRFSTNYSGSTKMSLWGITDAISGSSCNANLRLVHASELYGTGSYSGSVDYGVLEFGLVTDDKHVYLGTTDQLPLFDNDMWNVQIKTPQYINETHQTGSIYISVAKSADCTQGQITYSSSIYLNVDHSFYKRWGATGSYTKTAAKTFLGYTSSLNSGLYNEGLGYQPSNFSGSLQGYKEYFEPIKEEIFYSHTLNPAGYHGNSPTSSFYTLYRYWPLGVDSIRHDHTTKTQITSSQPNRSISFSTTASFYRFQGNQSTQYTGYREQFYIYSPTIGGQNITSDKLRLESTTLKHELSTEARAEKGKYDFAPIDTNRLVIAFSPTDQINRDIYNHIGLGELDDYIGDPKDSYESTYNSLKQFNAEYWKKWARRFDLNEFIKIFSVYDYTIFEQIRQTLPARVDYIGGVLIEPHILERPKLARKRPSIENPQWETIFSYKPRESGLYSVYTSSFYVTSSIESDYEYKTGSLNLQRTIDSEYNYYTSSLFCTASVESSYLYYTSSFRLYDPYTGSLGCTESIVDATRVNCVYKKVVYHYSSSNTYVTEYRRKFATFVSKSYGWHYSRSLAETCYQIDECSVRNRIRFQGSKLTGPDFNIDSTETVDGGPVVSWREVVTNSSKAGNLKV